MNPDTPSRSREYNGPITRAARWDAYRPRAGDIIVSAPAKSGMTWIQAICAMLIFGRADIGVQPAKLSPWFDSTFEPLGPMLKRLEAQTHRRYLKTHTPLDGLPYFPEVHYLAVYRHPLDAFHSAAALAQAAARGRLPAQPGVPTDIRSYMLECIRTPLSKIVGEQLSVASVANHFSGFWTYRALPNIHLFHYADMTRDLRGSIASIASALGIAVDERTVAAMADAAGFANMQARARQFVPASDGGWKDPREFFRSGTGGQWKGVLNEDDLAEYRRAYEAAIPDPAAAAWLENGNG
jgi:aryl sulfotransferase